MPILYTATVFLGVGAMFAMLSVLYKGLISGEDLNPEHTKQWRRLVGHSILLLAFFAVLMVSALTKGLPRVGSIVWAADLKTEVKSVLDPIDQRLGKVEGIVAQQSISTRALLARLALDQINQLVKRRCKSKDSDEIEYISREIRRYNDEYEANIGKRYDVPSCDEVAYREKR